MADRSRIPPKPSLFTSYLISTDDLQLSIDEVSKEPRWKIYKWTEEESAQWTSFRKRAEKLYAACSAPRSGHLAKLEIKLLIKEVNRYDHGGIKPHHLLEGVKIFGEMDDWITFRIKEGTPLAKKNIRTNGEVGSQRPQISIRKIEYNRHVLSITNADKPRSRALPPGISAIYVYRYVGEKPPDDANKYELIGNAKRGIYRSNVSKYTVRSEKKIYAWYIACYKSTHGKRGLFCAPQKAIIIN